MRQTGHIVVVYGVDDGLHHEGVFLILDGWVTQLLFCYSQNDLILSTIILQILSVTCPLSFSFIFFSSMNAHRRKKNKTFLWYL